jgi:type I restriction enzyme, R subunit
MWPPPPLITLSAKSWLWFVSSRSSCDTQSIDELSYLKAAGIATRPPGGWGRRAPKPAIEVTTDFGAVSTGATVSADRWWVTGATGFAKIKALKDAVNAVYTSDTTKRRFEILARQVFIRFRALVTEPTAYAYAERHDNIEAIYKKLTERRDTADVTALLKELHRIVNEAIRTQTPGEDQAEGLTFDLSKIDLEKLRNEFAKKVSRKAMVIQDIRTIVEQKLADMLACNPTRMDYQLKYEQIISEYNQEKDRTTIEETFRKLIDLVNSLDEEQERATREGLGEEELALFDVLLQEKKGAIDKTARERVKQASTPYRTCDRRAHR